MKFINKINKYVVMTVAFIAISSCELDEFTADPNSASPEAASADFVVNNIQLDFRSFFNSMSRYGMETTRIINPFGSTYDNAYQSTRFSFVWRTAYAGLLNDAQSLIPMAEESELYMHSGIAKILSAYTLMTLVDYFANVPLSEALDPDNFVPKADSGQEVYAEALILINGAIEDFKKESLGTPAYDGYYDGDQDKWLTFAYTLKLRYYLQVRLVDNSAAGEINTLLTADDLIDTPEEDFAFHYGTNVLDPDTRHPFFSTNYITGGSDYMSNFYMWNLYLGKAFVDPRIRYYFYRQVGVPTTDPNELQCIGTQEPSHYPAGMVYCDVGDGYWGRDHLNNEGIPPDNLKRTVPGLYPGGGNFDNDAFEGVSSTDGAQGEGILPILMHPFVDFMKAEATLMMGTSGDARVSLEDGVRNSISSVMNFNTAVPDPLFVPTAAEVNSYVALVLSDYDAASDKMDVIAKEFWLALWGNGVDASNLYKRTGGLPSGMQPAIVGSPGEFPRTFVYPANYVNNNANADQKLTTVQVFWDTNPAGVIK